MGREKEGGEKEHLMTIAEYYNLPFANVIGRFKRQTLEVKWQTLVNGKKVEAIDEADVSAAPCEAPTSAASRVRARAMARLRSTLRPSTASTCGGRRGSSRHRGTWTSAGASSTRKETFSTTKKTPRRAGRLKTKAR